MLLLYEYISNTHTLLLELSDPLHNAFIEIHLKAKIFYEKIHFSRLFSLHGHAANSVANHSYGIILPWHIVSSYSISSCRHIHWYRWHIHQATRFLCHAELLVVRWLGNSKSPLRSTFPSNFLVGFLEIFNLQQIKKEIDKIIIHKPIILKVKQQATILNNLDIAELVHL